MSFIAARASLLNAWEPPAAILTPQEEASLRAHVTELRLASVHDMWKAATFLAGTLVEGLLRKRLSLLVPSPSIPETATLGSLMNIGRDRGIFPAPTPRLSGAESLSAALVLRNWSAHYKLWAKYPNQVRATQAIALMLCTAEALFPDNPVHAERQLALSQQLRSSVTGTVIAFLRAPRFSEPSFDVSIYPQLCERATYGSGLTTVVHLADAVRRHRFPEEPLRQAIVANFGHLVRHAWSASQRYLMKTVRLLNRLSLADHARTFSILLPFDAPVIARFVASRPPAETAFYLQACHAAEP